MTENRFRERRSAHRDESEPEPDASAAPLPASTATAPAEGVEQVDPAPLAEPVAAVENVPPAERDAPLDDGPLAEHVAPTGSREEGVDEAGLELERLAEMDVPEPSFFELLEPHVEMALRFLGELPLTPDGERRILPRWAKREIDLLGLVEQRTRGNLPLPEQQYLQQALDQLRTLYLKVGG